MTSTHRVAHFAIAALLATASLVAGAGDGDQPAPAAPLGTPLPSIWNLGEQDPGAAAGFSGNPTTTDAVGGAHLIRTGDPRYSSMRPTAYGRFSMNFSPVGDNRYTRASPVSTATDNFVIEAWALTTNSAGARIIAYNGNSASDGWGLLQNNSTYVGLFGGVTVIGSAPAPLDAWTHLALVRANGIATLYVNGVASGTSSLPPVAPTSGFAIAGSLVGVQRFSGLVDQVRAYAFTTFEPTRLSTYCTDPLITTSQFGPNEFIHGCYHPFFTFGGLCNTGPRICRVADELPDCATSSCMFMAQAEASGFPYRIRELEVDGIQGTELFAHLFFPVIGSAHTPTIFSCEGNGAFFAPDGPQTAAINATTLLVDDMPLLRSLTTTPMACVPFKSGPIISIGPSTANPRGWYVRYVPADRTHGQAVARLVVAANVPGSAGAPVPLWYVTINLANVAPTVTTPGSASADFEGNFVIFNDVSGAFTDPGGSTDAPYSGRVFWGDGGSDALTLNTSNGNGPYTYSFNGSNFHRFAQSGVYSVTARITDRSGATGTSAARTVTIANVAPTVSAPDIAPAAAVENVATTFAISGTFSDPADALDAPFVVVVAWGDGETSTGVVTGSNNPFGYALDAAHTYAQTGDYNVTVSVTDKDGGTGLASAVVAVRTDLVLANGFE